MTIEKGYLVRATLSDAKVDTAADAQTAPLGLPTDCEARKALPIFDGVIMYFPDAIAAVAEVSVAGNEQHNSGEPLHWARGKSMDQFNTALRHMVDHRRGNVFDTEKSGKRTRHLAKAAWRVLAALQLSIEAEHDARRQDQTDTR